MLGTTHLAIQPMAALWHYSLFFFLSSLVPRSAHGVCLSDDALSYLPSADSRDAGRFAGRLFFFLASSGHSSLLQAVFLVGFL